jgi:O-antigen ligase
LFLLGVLIPSLYLITTYQELWSWSVLGVFGLVGSFALLYLRFRPEEVGWDKWLLILSFLWGGYIWILRNLVRVGTGTWRIEFLVASGMGLFPYSWLLLARQFAGRPRDYNPLLAGLVTGALTVALSFLFALRPWSFGLTVSELYLETSYVLGNTRNSVSLLWVVGFAIMLTWRTQWRWIRYLGLGLFAISIAYSYSRSAYLALLTVTLAHTYTQQSNRRSHYLVLGSLAILLLSVGVRERISQTWSPGAGLDSSSAVRLILWQAAIGAFFRSPVWGIGLDQFTNYLLQSGYSDYVIRSAGGLITEAIYPYAHNYFLSLFALTGAIGGLLGLAVFWRGYWRSKQVSQQGRPLGQTVRLCIVAYFVASLFGEPLFDPPLLTIFVILLAAIIFKSPTTK